MSREEIISVIIAFIGSGVLNAFISNILYSKKLKKELKKDGNAMLAEEIEKSLLEIRELELKTKEQEILNVEEELNSRGSKVNLFGNEAIYPAIYNDNESLRAFFDDIQICRKRYEQNVSNKIALNLVFIDRYIAQSMLFIKDNIEILNMQEWAALFIIDIQRWRIKFDKMLIKEINKHKYRLESHETIKWNKLRKKELEKQYEGTILSFLLTGKCNKKDRKMMNVIENYINDLKNEEKEEALN